MVQGKSSTVEQGSANIWKLDSDGEDVAPDRAFEASIGLSLLLPSLHPTSASEDRLFLASSIRTFDHHYG